MFRFNLRSVFSRLFNVKRGQVRVNDILGDHEQNAHLKLHKIKVRSQTLRWLQCRGWFFNESLFAGKIISEQSLQFLLKPVELEEREKDNYHIVKLLRRPKLYFVNICSLASDCWTLLTYGLFEHLSKFIHAHFAVFEAFKIVIWNNYSIFTIQFIA